VVIFIRLRIKGMKNLPTPNTIFYEISKEGMPTSYLLGTIHDFPRLPGNILMHKAFLGAAKILLEMPSDGTPGFFNSFTSPEHQIELTGRLMQKSIVCLDTTDERTKLVANDRKFREKRRKSAEGG
jgi:uncharacterized protein YbaP (TraB family)